MKIIITVAVLFISSFRGLAQAQPPHDSKSERIESAKIGMITNRLNLTEAQAKDFWVVYNDYDDKRTEIRQALRKIHQENRTSSDEQVVANLREIMSLRQREVDLDKDYMNKFLKTISPRQLLELFKTEAEFTRMLLHKLNKMGNDGGEGFRRKAPRGQE